MFINNFAIGIKHNFSTQQSIVFLLSMYLLIEVILQNLTARNSK